VSILVPVHPVDAYAEIVAWPPLHATFAEVLPLDVQPNATLALPVSVVQAASLYVIVVNCAAMPVNNTKANARE
jgi:hypothetical protein